MNSKFDDIRKAAEQGDASAQYYLGRAYARGEGVAKDQVEGVKWLRKAAGQGHRWAQDDLGDAYLTGEGVAKDLVEAYAWYNLGAVTESCIKKKRDDLENIATAQQVAAGQRRSAELSTVIENLPNGGFVNWRC